MSNVNISYRENNQGRGIRVSSQTVSVFFKMGSSEFTELDAKELKEKTMSIFQEIAKVLN